MPEIKFLPSGKIVQAEVGDSLLEVSKKNKLGINYHCDGVPNCAICRVVINEGLDHLSPIEQNEITLIGTSHWITRQRLSCQAKIISDGVIEVDLAEQIEYEKHVELKQKKNSERRSSPSKLKNKRPVQHKGASSESSKKTGHPQHNKSKNKSQNPPPAHRSHRSESR